MPRRSLLPASLSTARARLRAAAALHPAMALAVSAGRDTCFATLAAAARPSTSRLHLRDLFREGRRYYLRPVPDGFELVTDTRRLWSSSRSRTTPAAMVRGEMAETGSEQSPVTIIRLRASIRSLPIAGALAFPLFVAVLVLASPFSLPIKAALAVSLAVLAFLAQRFEAAYQAHIMFDFVRKALDDLPHPEAPRLDVGRGDVVDGDTSFSQAWQRFYEEQMGRAEE